MGDKVTIRKGHTHPNSVAAFKEARKRASASQLEVLKALQELKKPAHYRMISQHLMVIEGCVTPRISELKRKEFIKVAYVNFGFDRIKVNYYVLTYKGKKHLDEVAETE